MPMHFGPLSVVVYADGLTEDGQRACGAAVLVDSDCHDASLYPHLVDCKACRRTSVFRQARHTYAADGARLIPSEDRIDKMRWRDVNGAKWSIDENNARRLALGLDPVFPTSEGVDKLRSEMRALRLHYDASREEAAVVAAEAKRLGLRHVSIIRTDAETGLSHTHRILTDALEERSAQTKPRLALSETGLERPFQVRPGRIPLR